MATAVELLELEDIVGCYRSDCIVLLGASE